MDINKKDELIDKFLIFMKNDLELNGFNIKQAWFDFQPEYTEQYFGHPSKTFPESKDLTSLRKVIDITDRELLIIIKYCITHELIRYCQIGGSEYQNVQMLDKGMSRAISVEKSKTQKTDEEVKYGNTYNVSFMAPVNGSNVFSDNSTITNIENSFNELLEAIDNSNTTPEEKKESKDYLLKLLESPVFNFALSNSDKISSIVSLLKSI